MRLENRQGERVPRNNRVSIQVIRQDANAPVAAKLVDVSASGLGFEALTHLEPGERLRVRVELESTMIVSQRLLFVQGSAVVKRVKELGADPAGPWRVGAAWEKLERAEQEKWKDFLGKTRSMMF